MRELLQQCLNKFEQLWEIGIDAEYKVDLMPEIRALRTELAKPDHGFDRTASHMAGEYVDTAEQEPAAYVDSKTIEWFLKPERSDEAFSIPTLTKKPTDYCDVPLYIAPPRKEWVGLTDEEAAQIIMDSDPNNRFELCRNIEDKLKEKNCTHQD